MIISNKRITKVADQTAQAGLRLCCSQTPEDRFSRVEVHIILTFNNVYKFPHNFPLYSHLIKYVKFPHNFSLFVEILSQPEILG